jgi:uncharacterized membrane protein YcaP (DUF421 family)
MFLSAVSVLVVVLLGSVVPEGLTNNPVIQCMLLVHLLVGYVVLFPYLEIAEMVVHL